MYSFLSIYHSAASWINSTSHLSLLRKIRKFLDILRDHVTCVGSVCTFCMAHVVEWFLSTVCLNPVATICYTVGELGIAANRYVGSDPPQFSTMRKCCQIFVHRGRNVADRCICHRSMTKKVSRVLYPNSNWFSAGFESVWNIWCRWLSIPVGHFTLTFSADDICITLSNQKKIAKDPLPLQHIITLVQFFWVHFPRHRAHFGFHLQYLGWTFWISIPWFVGDAEEIFIKLVCQWTALGKREAVVLSTPMIIKATNLEGNFKTKVPLPYTMVMTTSWKRLCPCVLRHRVHRILCLQLGRLADSDDDVFHRQISWLLNTLRMMVFRRRVMLHKSVCHLLLKGLPQHSDIIVRLEFAWCHQRMQTTIEGMQDNGPLQWPTFDCRTGH